MINNFNYLCSNLGLPFNDRGLFSILSFWVQECLRVDAFVSPIILSPNTTSWMHLTLLSMPHIWAAAGIRVHQLVQELPLVASWSAFSLPTFFVRLGVRVVRALLHVHLLLIVVLLLFRLLVLAAVLRLLRRRRNTMKMMITRNNSGWRSNADHYRTRALAQWSSNCGSRTTSGTRALSSGTWRKVSLLVSGTWRHHFFLSSKFI